MAFQPTRAGPKGIRELYHWVWGQLNEVGKLLGSGESTPHLLYGPNQTDVDTTDTLDLGDVLMFDGTVWVPFDALDTFVSAGYGGVIQTGNPILPDIDGTPQILPANAGVATTPRAVVQDFANDGLHFGFTGIWTLHISIAIAHDNVNAARTVELQLYNATEASILTSSPVFIARNQDGLNFSTTIMVEIPVAGLNDLYVLRVVSIFGADIQDVVLTNYQFSANLVSQLLVIP